MFIYIGNNEKINEAVETANIMVMSHQGFALSILGKKSFDMTDVNGTLVFNDMKGVLLTKDVYIKVYYPWYRFSRAYGYFTASRPFDINMNGYKLRRSHASLVGTLVHELVHMADNLNKKAYYGHGDNSSKGKGNTAPYLIGGIASAYSGNVNDNIENNTYKKRSSMFTCIKKLTI